MGSSLGPHWHSDRASSTEKIKKKIQVRYIHPLKITYLSPGAKYTLRRLFPWVLCAACMIQNPPPYRASFRARIRGLCSWISCKYRQRCPMGRSSMSWFFFFFFPPIPVIFWVQKEKSKADSLPKRGGEMCLFTQLLSYLSKRALRSSPRSPHLPLPFSPRFTFCLLHTAPWSRSRWDVARTNVLAGDLYLPGWAWGICHAEIPFGGIFGDLEKLCVSH